MRIARFKQFNRIPLRFLFWDRRFIPYHFAIVLSCFLALEIAYYLVIGPEQGEGFTILIGDAFYGGQTLYSDIAYHHPPAGPLVYGFFRYVFGWGLYGLRAVTVALNALILVLVYDVLRRSEGQWAGLAGLYLLVFNDAYHFYHGFIHNRSVTTFFAILCVWLLVRLKNNGWRSAAVVTAAFLSALTRLTSVPLFAMVFLYSLYRCKGIRQRVFGVLVPLGICGTVAAWLIEDWTVFYQQVFLINSPVNRLEIETLEAYRQALHTGGYGEGLLAPLLLRLKGMVKGLLLDRTFWTFVPWKQFLAGAIVVLLWYRQALFRAFRNLSADHWFVVGASVLWFAATWFIGFGRSAVYWFHSVPMLVVAAVFVMNRLAGCAGDRGNRLRYLLIAVVYWTAIEFGYPKGVYTNYHESAVLTDASGREVKKTQLAYAYEVAEFIEGQSKRGDLVLTSWGLFAGLSNRRLVAGLGEHDWSYRPYWSDEVCRYFGFVNRSLLERSIVEGEAEIVLISGNRENPFDFVYVFDADQAQFGGRLVDLIKEKYKPIRRFPQVTPFRRDLWVYKKRRGP